MTAAEGAGTIVPVNEANLPEAAAIHAASWQASHRAFCAPDFINMRTPERQLAYLRDKLNHGAEIWMLVDEAPAGIVSVTGSLIEDLYVLPDRQNRGYGTRLLLFAVRRCPDLPTLWILENNTDAARLYRRMGFAETGRRSAITEDLDEIEFALRSDPGGAGAGPEG